MKVAIIGTHGTGKTTLVYRLVGALKEESLNAGVVSEVAGICPLAINEGASLESQIWIMAKQITLELEATNKHDIAVCDRAILDSYVYTLHLCKKQKKKMPKWLSHVLKDYLPTYDFLFKTKINPNYLKGDGIRSVSAQWQEEIECLMNNVLKQKNILHYLLPENEQVNYMMEMVKKKWSK